MRKARTVTDRQVERFIGMLLRVGVLAAACIAGAGGVWHLWDHGRDVPHYGSFRGEPPYLTKAAEVIRAAASLKSDAVIQLGILVLISVPILRVVVSIAAFALERDWLYCVVTALVLAVLLFSLLGGLI